jgi:putative hydrolase of the HAD superfamily
VATDVERSVATMVGAEPGDPLAAPEGIDTIGFDADDTLWHNEDDFHASQQMLRELLAPYAGHGPDVDAHLLTVERRNLEVFGYGVKGFLLSMIETAIELSDGAISAGEIQVLLERGKAMIRRPVELLDGVEEVLQALAGRYRLVLITLGDLFHQEQKIAASGLSPYFDHVEVVSEKDPDTYRRILARHGIDPQRFLMVGNSMRSDILPVLEIGGHAVHVPYHFLWAHQHAVCERPVPTLDHLGDLPAWLGATS